MRKVKGRVWKKEDKARDAIESVEKQKVCQPTAVFMIQKKKSGRHRWWNMVKGLDSAIIDYNENDEEALFTFAEARVKHDQFKQNKENNK